MADFEFIFTDLQKSDTEMLVALLSEQATGFEENENSLKAFAKTRDAFEEVLKKFPALTYTINEIREQNWNELWESSFEAVTICSGEKPFVHLRASFHPENKDAEHEIIITPKMSFGTGHHATTSLVIEKMASVDFENKSLIDFGTGTGVLAILAEKLDAKKILAIDNDEWSIRNSSENISANHCNKIEIILSDKLPEEKTDVLIANINLNIILHHLKKMNECLYLNGILILSGMLVDDKERIEEALSLYGFKVSHIADKNNWIAVTAIKINEAQA